MKIGRTLPQSVRDPPCFGHGEVADDCEVGSGDQCPHDRAGHDPAADHDLEHLGDIAAREIGETARRRRAQRDLDGRPAMCLDHHGRFDIAFGEDEALGYDLKFDGLRRAGRTDRHRRQ